ncbi:CCCH-type zinc finger transcription factor [Phycomyces blakesleeanus]|uniref:CCCH-type zinc finger transcription factor n=2 Tax=Phycomyces blakesleeanus TaxID=4837 RepID=A0A162NBX5_PHYB8|nr:CCCH-type zinc finger transcription factor [Phycomyces blakesleeanus NRRL 1555(-)]OAD67824.1 CCCH-type zinc finger transcription factor [Phycomyces blakesleeanus NRRL 1555(-)]|eukprot:XP_018285864.1 CCCH-type zinc finger transcription factor [Phycomyces blakesleeanus NRRL 1555(-)]
MPRKYECDFCQCSFPDNSTNRKKHLQGAVHQANRKRHYDWFKDPNEFVAEQMNKPPCRHFFTHGQCEFGLSCKFSHIAYATSGEPILSPELIQWLQSRNQEQNQQSIAHQKKTEQQSARKRSRYRLPTGWKVRSLPPSLCPPKKQEYDWTDTGYWG